MLKLNFSLPVFRKIGKAALRFLCAIGLLTVVITLVPLFGYSIRHHFVTLLARSWEAMVSGTSTNTPGFLLWTLALAVVGWAAPMAAEWWKLKRQGYGNPFRQALSGSRLSGLFLAIGYSGLIVIAFGTSLVRIVYQDHEALVRRNTTVAAEKSDLQRKLAENCKDDKQRADDAETEASRAKDDARHWREAYQETTHGDLHPDRHLDREDRRKLREQLEQVTKDPRNKDYIKLDFGMSPSIEAAHLGWQIYNIFRETHWNVPAKIKTDYPKELQEYMQVYGPASYASGIYIISDDPFNRGQYLASIFNSCCGLSVIVNPRGIPPNFKGTMLWVGNKWFTNWKDND